MNLIILLLCSAFSFAESKTQLVLKLESEGKTLEFAPTSGDPDQSTTVEAQAKQGPRRARVSIAAEKDAKDPSQNLYRFTVDYTSTDNLNFTSYIPQMAIKPGGSQVYASNGIKYFTLTARLIDLTPQKISPEKEKDETNQGVGVDIKQGPNDRFMMQ